MVGWFGLLASTGLVVVGLGLVVWLGLVGWGGWGGLGWLGWLGGLGRLGWLGWVGWFGWFGLLASNGLVVVGWLFG